MSIIDQTKLDRITALDRQHQDLATATIAFHETVARRLGMTAAERKCLGVLGKLGTCTPGQLADATGLTTGAITGIVDRLEQVGYLERQPNPIDRRSILLHPLRSRELKRLTQPVFLSLGTAMAELAGGYTVGDLDLILGYVARTTELLRREAVHVQTQTPARRLTARPKPARKLSA
jgi:DNA-binding MarR family transcriptional regulator